MIEIYYLCAFIITLFYQKKSEGKYLNFITIVIVTISTYIIYQRSYLGFSLENTVIISELLGILVSLITYKYHKNKFIFVPLILSLLINYSYSVVDSYEYRYFIYDYYNIINIILFEMLLYNCIRYTPIPSKINNISNNMLSYVNEKLRNTNKPQNIHFS